MPEPAAPGETPVQALAAFVAAFNALDPAAMAHRVLAAGPAGFAFPAGEIPSWRAVLGEAMVESDEATVAVTLTVFGETEGSPPPETLFELVRLRRVGGAWRILPIDPEYLRPRSDDADRPGWIGSLAALVTDAQVMAEAWEAAEIEAQRSAARLGLDRR